jgi:hypothetical protein
MLRSPRGLAVLAELCGHPARSVTPEDVVEPPDVVTIEDLARALLAVDGMAWWSDRAEVGQRLLAAAPAYVDAARVLAAAGPWANDLDRTAQVTFGAPSDPPRSADLLRDQHELMTSGVPERIAQALVTSTWLGPRLPALVLCAGEHRERWPDPLGNWAVEIDPDVRVHEIHVPEDWAALCARYPRVVATRDDQRWWGVTTPEAVIPDWAAVARDVDAVHVSVAGVLCAVGAPVVVGDRQCVLEDVDAEVTAWLRPSFRVIGSVMTRRRDDLPGDPT